MIKDKGSISEMSIWCILLIQSDFKKAYLIKQQSVFCIDIMYIHLHSSSLLVSRLVHRKSIHRASYPTDTADLVHWLLLLRYAKYKYYIKVVIVTSVMRGGLNKLHECSMTFWSLIICIDTLH